MSATYNVCRVVNGRIVRASLLTPSQGMNEEYKDQIGRAAWRERV